VETNVSRRANTADIVVPIAMARKDTGAETWIALSSPIAPDVPTDEQLRKLADVSQLVCVNDLLVRRNLPAAIRQVLMRLNS
jgi:hypothetical protein